MTDFVFRRIVEYLRGASSLQSLDLNFYLNEGITNKGLKYLGDGLEKFSSLHTISLNFDSCRNITDRGVKSLRNRLQKLTNLRNLVLLPEEKQ